MDLAIQNFRSIRKVNPVVGVVSASGASIHKEVEASGRKDPRCQFTSIGTGVTDKVCSATGAHAVNTEAENSNAASD